MSENREIVTIDGPSGVGKSTISRSIAQELGFTYLDTGAMYRGVACHLVRSGVDLNDEVKIGEVLEDLVLELIPAGPEGAVGVRLNGVDSSIEIRSARTTMAASQVSALGVVRTKLTRLQQEIGRNGRVVAEGRDTGTVVFPHAFYKFYLDADPRERARRRALQLREKGEQVDISEVLAQQRRRDENDSQRAIAPLKRADDAVAVDTTGITIEQVTRTILEVIRERREKTADAAT